MLLPGKRGTRDRSKTEEAPADDQASGVNISQFDRLRLVVDGSGRFVTADTGSGADQPQCGADWFSLPGRLQVSQSPETSRHYHYP